MFRNNQQRGFGNRRGGTTFSSRGGGANHFNPNYISVSWTPPEKVEDEAKTVEPTKEKVKKIPTPEEKQKEKDRKHLLNMKKWRIIVRNLPFSITQEAFKEAFKKYGEVVEASLPTKKDPKGNTMLRGFGFIQFAKFPDAHSAMKALNLQDLSGRKVAVDWAAPKDEYLSATLKDKTALSSTDETEKGPKEGADVKMTEVKPDTPSESKGDIKEENSSDESDSDDSHSDTPSSGESDEEESAPKKKMRKRNQPSDEKENTTKPDEGIQQGRTLFVRNLSFDTTGEDFKAYFEKLGKLKYAVICKYPDTEHSRGTGFVQYETAEEANEVIKKGERIEQLDKGLKLDGRWLSICRAMEKSEAKRIESDKKDKEPKDKRNLNLMRIGFIRQGTDEANGMSDEDAAKRMKIAAAAKAKIKDLHIFVSPTRICVHNMPPTVNDQTLRKICLNSVKDDSAKLKECRIMRDKDRQNSSGLGKSRGFAFVEFSEHSHALACVKSLNNNPAIFTDKKRPIVEFSLENLVALNRRKLRDEKGRRKQQEMKELDPLASTTPSKNSKKTQKRNKKKIKKTTNKESSDNSSMKDTVEPSDSKNRTFPVKTVQNLSDTKKALKEKGLKPLPTRLGPKIRHKKKNSTVAKSKSSGTGKKSSKTVKVVANKVSAKRKSRKEKRNAKKAKLN